MNFSDEAIRSAARWWRDRLPGGEPDHNARNIDGSPQMVMVVGLASVFRNEAAEKITEEMRQRFEDCLFNRLSAMVKANGRWIFLGVDYDPDMVLSSVLVEADLGRLVQAKVLPWKTNMHFKEDGIYVSEGYMAPDVRIWPKEEK